MNREQGNANQINADGRPDQSRPQRQEALLTSMPSSSIYKHVGWKTLLPQAEPTPPRPRNLPVLSRAEHLEGPGKQGFKSIKKLRLHQHLSGLKAILFGYS